MGVVTSPPPASGAFTTQVSSTADILARLGQATQVGIGDNGFGAGSITLGNAADTSMRRTAAGEITATSDLVTVGQVRVGTIFRHLGASLGFYGAVAVARTAAYTLTWATRSRVLAAATRFGISATAPTSVAPWGYTTQAQAQAVLDEINNLNTDLTSTQNVLAQLIADFKANGMMQ